MGSHTANAAHEKWNRANADLPFHQAQLGDQFAVQAAQNHPIRVSPLRGIKLRAFHEGKLIQLVDALLHLGGDPGGTDELDLQ
jgi:hypothetical protein